jgi:hypothetical protein
METQSTAPAREPAPPRTTSAVDKVRPHDWAVVALVVSGALAALLIVRGQLLSATVCALLAVAAAAVARAWSRKYPGPMPSYGWWTLLVPRGRQSSARLTALLGPCPGERMLEIGPGIGVYSLPIAASLLPDGQLDVLDVQDEMLNRLTRRGRKARVANIVATQGDAQRLPYPDGSFDAAYLTSVLGEIPDQSAALRGSAGC